MGNSINWLRMFYDVVIPWQIEQRETKGEVQWPEHETMSVEF